LLIVHRSTYVPYAVTAAVELPLVGALNVTVPGPLILLHAPLPTVGVFPPNARDTRAHTLWLAPTLAAVGVCQ
jgi:hypothetical protein